MKAGTRDTSHLKRQVCKNTNGITSIVYSDKTLAEATKIVQSMNDEAGEHIPKYFVRIQRRRK